MANHPHSANKLKYENHAETEISVSNTDENKHWQFPPDISGNPELIRKYSAIRQNFKKPLMNNHGVLRSKPLVLIHLI